MTATSEDWRECYAAPLIMITLAGHCALARARRPDRDGWRRQFSAEELVSIHEAGHAVATVAVGHHQNGAVIERTENGCRGIAEHSAAMLPPEHAIIQPSSISTSYCPTSIKQLHTPSLRSGLRDGWRTCVPCGSGLM